MDAEQKRQLLERFQLYLDQHDSTVADDTAEEIDLYSLFVELAAVKNEVKLESRQVKSALDEFKRVLAMMRDGHERLQTALERSQTALERQRQETLRPLLLELLDLHDRLEAGGALLADYRPAGPRWLHRRSSVLIAAVGEAQMISLRRLQKLLQMYQVEPIAAAGRPLDPYRMRAVAVEHRDGLANGVVTEELRKGFDWQGVLLRPAEVKVNKLEDQLADRLEDGHANG